MSSRTEALTDRPPVLTNPFRIRLSRRRALQIGIDLLLAFVSWALAYLVRFNFDLNAAAVYVAPVAISIFALVQVAMLASAGIYSRLWRYTGLQDLRQMVVGLALGELVVLALTVVYPAIFFAPRSTLLAQPVFFLMLVGGVRVMWRMAREKSAQRQTLLFGEPVIVAGAGDAGAALLREFDRSRRWRAVALLDDDPHKRNTVLNNVRIAGTLAEYATVAARYRVRKVVIAIPSLAREHRDVLARQLSKQGAEVYTLPPLDALQKGEVADDAIRRVRPQDLLRRDPIVLDSSLLGEGIAGKVVLVTGAGGSIGSELCRQLADLQPALLVLFELNEYALYEIDEELHYTWPTLSRASVIGDVRDEPRVAEVMTRFRPDVVFHAAAYKHVPLMEQVNAFEALRNNALGTLVVAESAVKARVGKLVVVSTDKAVNPTNVMGATKRLAETLVQEVASGHDTKVSIVRFGNVLGSAGSVIPKFLDQIQRGGPVTVTHPEITRYFMSIPEASQLVVLSSSIGRGGEIFVLDMGEPVRIADLARDLIHLMGKNERDIDIVFTGLRPGEKLFEELLFDTETTVSTNHKRLRIARVRPPIVGARAAMVEWLRERPLRSDFEVRQFLRRLVPEYTPDERYHSRALESA
jgi:FlaA1/EpsC-like NDP-sugar epimerase